MVKLNAGAGALSLCVLLAFLAGLSAAGGGYDNKTYVDEDKVRKVVETAIIGNPGIGAALIRLVFHDCWVNGCDGSVLLDNTPYSRSSNLGTEKNASKNIGLDGFDVIDGIKAVLGEGVSCADIVVLAARDAAGILSGGKITYPVETGRKDGVVSSAIAADATLPASTFDFQQLKDNFGNKNFSQEELVILSGAHSVGVCHLSSFQDRFNSATATPIDPKYKAALLADVQEKQKSTSNPTEKNNIRDMDQAFRNKSGYSTTGVDTAATGVLDNSYYHADLQNMVLLKSDWVLRTDGDAANDLQEYRDNATKWTVDFSNAMAKLSKLPAEGSHFEIRKKCRDTNQKYYY